MLDWIIALERNEDTSDNKYTPDEQDEYIRKKGEFTRRFRVRNPVKYRYAPLEDVSTPCAIELADVYQILYRKYGKCACVLECPGVDIMDNSIEANLMRIVIANIDDHPRVFLNPRKE